jgi:hypothetical protein
MKQVTRSLFLAVTLSLSGSLAYGGEIGHYAGGFLNIRDFFVPEPGMYGSVYNYFYTTDRLNNKNGDKIGSVTVNPGGGPGVTLDLEVDVNMYVLAPTFVLVTDTGAYGVKYGMLVTPNFANASLEGALSSSTGRGGSAEASDFAPGDAFVEPLWFGKTTEHWDFAVAYGFYAPIGKYNTQDVTLPGGASVEVESPDNIGFGFWTNQFQGAVAWYPWVDKRMAVTGALTYEIHAEKSGFDLTPGDDLTLNWGVSQYLPLKKDHTMILDVGLAGYDSWQVTDDSGSDAVNPNVHDQVHAVGGQLGFVYVPWHTSITAHGFYEYAAEDRFQGESFGLSIAKKF